MENDFTEILAIYPGMYASKFKVRADTWAHYIENCFNTSEPGCCFLPCRDMEGEPLFVDMNKLLAFYVPKKEKPAKKNKKANRVTEKSK